MSMGRRKGMVRGGRGRSGWGNTGGGGGGGGKGMREWLEGVRICSELSHHLSRYFMVLFTLNYSLPVHPALLPW